MVFMALEDAMELIRMEYHELPGLSLTFWQARRLWSLSDELCEVALRSLVREGFLTVTSSRTFVRRLESQVSLDGPALSPGHGERPNTLAPKGDRQNFAPT